MEKKTFCQYKGKPLVRKGDVIYYGDMSGNVVAMLTVKSKHELNGLYISDEINLQLIATDPQTSPKDIVIKHINKNGLCKTLDIARIWIDRYNKKMQ